MGMTVTASAGLGLHVSPDLMDAYIPDLLEENDLDLLTFKEAIWGYVDTGGGIFATSTFETVENGETFSFPADGSLALSAPEEEQLKVAAQILGIEYIPSFVFLHSYVD